MTLLGSLNAAVGGMSAQSASIGNISDNIANSQTVGFKETDTSFVDYLTDSSASTHSPGAVVARPNYTNTTQGAVTQVNNPTALAISGQGFFAVQRTSNGVISDPLTYYTRAGDFSSDLSGHLVNSTGYALEGWTSNNPAGTSFNTSTLTPITISKAASPPVPTSTISLAANLPATPTDPTSTSTVEVHDASGQAHDLTLTWTQGATPSTWQLAVSQDGSTTPFATAAVEFGTGPTASGGNGGTAGLITSLTPAGGTTESGTGTAATLALSPNLGFGPQAITLNLGSFGQTTGVTQLAGTTYQVSSQTQDGAAQGNYLTTTIQPNGNVVNSYDNGTSQVVAQVPLTSFNNPNALQQQDGQAFTATLDSGSANTFASGVGGVGKLIVGADEASNVDIATQFTQMIVAQRAYTANTKVISTTNQLLQDTLNMVQG